jgi:hypothetical protein
LITLLLPVKLLSLYHPVQALRRALSSKVSAISATAVICNPQTASSTSPGALSSEAKSGRSVGPRRGAGGVKREAETLVGKTKAIAVAGVGVSVAGAGEVAVGDADPALVEVGRGNIGVIVG